MRATTTSRIIAAAALIAALTACAGPDPAGGVERSEGVPRGLHVSILDAEQAAFITTTGQVIVVIWGSSSCRPDVTEFDNAEAVLNIKLQVAGGTNRPCTADLTGATYTFDPAALGDPAPEKVRLASGQHDDVAMIEIRPVTQQ